MASNNATGVTSFSTSCLTQNLFRPSESVSDPAVAEDTGLSSTARKAEA